MFKINIDIQNRKILRKIKQHPSHVRTGIRQAFFISGKQLKAYLQDKIEDKIAKTGRLYLIRRGKKVIRHRASAPGQYPAKLSGVLKRSINFHVVGYRQLIFGSRAPYAIFLEEGTKKMAPRKLLQATIKENIEFMQTTMHKEIIKELSKR